MGEENTALIKIKIGKTALILVIFSVFSFILGLFLNSNGILISDPTAYFIIFLFVLGIILYLTKRFIAILISKTKKEHLIVSSFILIVLFLFYWFQYRPTRIRSKCFRWIKDQPGDVEELRTESARVKYKALFDRCLNEKGIE